jgi:beta-apo-4'-carotenal oxygenase
LSPNAAAVMQRIIEEYLDTSAYFCVNGAVPEITELLNQKWDKIFYTGNPGVGVLIAKKAAETLTPVTLELGGKNPAIISRFADTRLAARRLVWGKVLNAGQVCLSQNYILIDKEALPSFVNELSAALGEFFPDGAKSSPDYARIINERHFHRIKKMLDETHGKILIGGAMDEKEKFIEPTVIQIDSLDDSLIKEESFGPLFPLLPVDDLDQAIRIANEVDSTPLAMYPFSKKKEDIDRRMRALPLG